MSFKKFLLAVSIISAASLILAVLILPKVATSQTEEICSGGGVLNDRICQRDGLTGEWGVSRCREDGWWVFVESCGFSELTSVPRGCSGGVCVYSEPITTCQAGGESCTEDDDCCSIKCGMVNDGSGGINKICFYEDSGGGDTACPNNNPPCVTSVDLGGENCVDTYHSGTDCQIGHSLGSCNSLGNCIKLCNIGVGGFCEDNDDCCAGSCQSIAGQNRKKCFAFGSGEEPDTDCSSYCTGEGFYGGECTSPDRGAIKPYDYCTGTVSPQCAINIQTAKDENGYDRPWIYCYDSDDNCYCYNKEDTICSPNCFLRCTNSGCQELEQENCCDGRDNNGNGDIDGFDAQCQKDSDPVVLESGETDVCWERMIWETPSCIETTNSKVFQCPGDGEYRIKAKLSYDLYYPQRIKIRDGRTGNVLQKFTDDASQRSSELFHTDRIYFEMSIQFCDEEYPDGEWKEYGYNIDSITCMPVAEIDCSKCDDGWTNTCEEEECYLIGNCFYRDRGFIMSWLDGGFCFEKSTVKFTVLDDITNKPVVGVEVKVRSADSANIYVGSCITDADGVCEKNLGLSDTYKAVVDNSDYICEDSCQKEFKVETNSLDVTLLAKKFFPCFEDENVVFHEKYTKGVTTDVYGSYTDKCTGRYNNRVTEYFCKNDYVDDKRHTCENDCKDGACLVQTFFKVDGVRAPDPRGGFINLPVTVKLFLSDNSFYDSCFIGSGSQRCDITIPADIDLTVELELDNYHCTDCVVINPARIPLSGEHAYFYFNMEINPSPPCADLGDVNGDGFIWWDDVALVYNNNVAPLFGDQRRKADVNGDGDVSNLDGNIILKYTSSAIDTFPACIMGDYLKIISPNGGEKILIGETQTITWNATEGIGNIDIFLMSIRPSWAEEMIAQNIPSSDGQYSWIFGAPRVGDFDELRHKISIKDVNGKILDTSDEYFTAEEEPPSVSPGCKICRDACLEDLADDNRSCDDDEDDCREDCYADADSASEREECRDDCADIEDACKVPYWQDYLDCSKDCDDDDYECGKEAKCSDCGFWWCRQAECEALSEKVGGGCRFRNRIAGNGVCEPGAGPAELGIKIEVHKAGGGINIIPSEFVSIMVFRGDEQVGGCFYQQGDCIVSLLSGQRYGVVLDSDKGYFHHNQVNSSDGFRVASDTKKVILWLQERKLIQCSAEAEYGQGFKCSDNESWGRCLLEDRVSEKLSDDNVFYPDDEYCIDNNDDIQDYCAKCEGEEPGCIDSDVSDLFPNGLNYKELGKANDSLGDEATDQCDSSRPKVLLEAICDNDIAIYSSHTCAFGCKDGVCLYELEEPICGNDILETGEECDDGNRANGDGCSDVCTIEEKAKKQPPCGNYGDVDEDGYVSEVDVKFVIDYITDKIDLSDNQKRNADVDGDGTVSTSDARLIFRYIESDIDTFSVCQEPEPACLDEGEVVNSRPLIEGNPCCDDSLVLVKKVGKCPPDTRCTAVITYVCQKSEPDDSFCEGIVDTAKVEIGENICMCLGGSFPEAGTPLEGGNFLVNGSPQCCIANLCQTIRLIGSDGTSSCSPGNRDRDCACSIANRDEDWLCVIDDKIGSCDGAGVCIIEEEAKKRPPCGSYGDVDGDGYVSEVDAELIFNYVMGRVEFSDEQKRNADVSANGDISTFDSRSVTQYIAGIIDTFDACQAPEPACLDEGEVVNSRPLIEGNPCCDKSLTLIGRETDCPLGSGSNCTQETIYSCIEFIVGPGSCDCRADYAPVCGEDGNNYRNFCLAECAGTTEDYKGRCEAVRPYIPSVEVTAGGVTAGLEVPEGAVNVDAKANITPIPMPDSDEASNFPGKSIGGYIFDYTITESADGKEIVSFNAPVTITITYTDEQISGFDEDDITIYYYDELSLKWRALPTTVDKRNNIATAKTTHFTPMMLGGPGAGAVDVPFGGICEADGDCGGKCCCCPASGCDVDHTGVCGNASCNNIICPSSTHTSLEDLISSIASQIFLIAVIIAPLMIVIGGFLFVTSGGSPSRSTLGKNIIKWAAIGLGFILFAKGIQGIIQQIVTG